MYEYLFKILNESQAILYKLYHNMRDIKPMQFKSLFVGEQSVTLNFVISIVPARAVKIMLKSFTIIHNVDETTASRVKRARSHRSWEVPRLKQTLFVK